ncbi:LOW QUALITY PROTEIN: uncharacterized protein WCC33_011420 [Rhinophrynus dorsalis]
MTDSEVIDHYRLMLQSIIDLYEVIKDEVDLIYSPNSALSSLQKLICAIHFMVMPGMGANRSSSHQYKIPKILHRAVTRFESGQQTIKLTGLLLFNGFPIDEFAPKNHLMSLQTVGKVSITTISFNCFKSHSHLMSLSLLLLLAAGDISPNPGPASILSCNATPTHIRNTHNLITVPYHLTSSPFCFGLWNAHSVCNKLTADHDLFTSHSLNLLAITETWLTSSDTASTASFSHGSLHFTHTPRPANRQGGGVGILLFPNHTFQVIPTVPSLSFSTFEAHTLHLFSPFPLRVAVIYRPSGPTAQFLDHFTSWLPHFMSSDIPALILGDFNIPVDNHNTPPPSNSSH